MNYFFNCDDEANDIFQNPTLTGFQQSGSLSTITIALYGHDDPLNVVPQNATSYPKWGELTLDVNSVDIIDIDNPSGCSIGSDICVYKVEYSTIVDLNNNNGTANGGFHVTHERCCRNNSIENISDPGGTGMTYYAWIPPIFSNNTSPEFTNSPLPFICVGDTTTALNTATDIDGDELIFSYVTPLKGNFTAADPPQNINPTDYPATYAIPIEEVQYGLGYSYESPFGAGGYYNVVASNGLTTYYSNIQGKFVVGVLIKEYREVNGQVLLYGVTTREVQLIVQNCPSNDSPQVNPFAGSISSIFSVEEGDSLCFDFGYYDPTNPPDLMTLYADGQIFDQNFTNPPATIQSPVSSNLSGQDTVNSRFCWDTDCGQYQSLPYIFSVSVVDQGCPPKTTNNVYEISVTPTNPPANIYGENIFCQNSTTVYSTDNNPSISYIWEVDSKGSIVQNYGDSVEVLWDTPGTGAISLSAINAHGCISSPISLDATITPSPSVNIDFPETICIGDSVELVGSTNANGYVSLWTSSGPISSPNNLQTFVSPEDTTTYYLNIDIGAECTGIDSVIVNVTSIDLSIGDDITICKGDTANIIASTDATIFNWTPESFIDNPNSPTISAWPTINTQYILEASAINGCSEKDTLVVFVSPIPGSSADFVLNGSATSLGNNEYLLTSAINWDTGAVWNSTLVNLNQPFHFDVDLYFGDQNDGADGIAFGLQQISNQILTPGGGIGYEGINPSFFVEFDTYQNTNLNDIANDHIAIQTNGVLNHNSSNNLFPPQSIGTGNIEDDQWHNCIFDWDPLNKRFTVNFDGVQLIDINYDIVTNIFSGTSATYWGFTASTGGLNNEQKIRYNSVTFFNEIIDQRICENDEILISAPVIGENYLWEPDNFINDNTILSPTFNPDTSSTYIFTATNSFGCFIKDTFEIIVDDLPIVFAGNNDSLCIGDSITLLANGNASNFQWNNSIIDGEKIEVVSSEDYVLTGTSTEGCINKDTISIIALTNPSTFTGENDGYINLCINDSVQLQAQGADNYLWTPSLFLSDATLSNPWASPNSSTQYILTGQSSNGCISLDTLLIDVNPLPNLSVSGNPTICQGDTVQIEASGGNLYNWLNNEYISNQSINNPNVWPLTTSSYKALVSDINTCEDTVEVIVTVNQLPNVSAGNDQNICFGDSSSLNASGSAQNYVWNNGIIDGELFQINSSQQYVLTGTDVNNCVNYDTVNIVSIDLPIIDIGEDLSICVGDSVQLNASGGENYTWSPISFISNINISNPFVSPVAPTQYFVLGTDNNGCSNIDSINISINQLPNISVSNDTSLCYGDTIKIFANGGSTYQWLNSDSINNVNTNNPDIWPNNSSLYSVVVTNDNNCSDTASINITVNQLPNVSAGNDQNICFGDTTQLNASGATNYTWSPSTNISSTTSNVIDAWPSSTISYIVLGKDINECLNTDTIFVNVLDLPFVDAGEDQWLCPGDSIELNVNQSTNYEWSPDSTLSNSSIQNPTASPLLTSEYVIKITDNNSCSNFDTVIVKVELKVPTDAGEDTLTICEGLSVELGGSPTSPPNTVYQWITELSSDTNSLSSTSESNPLATPLSPTLYIVGTNNFICTGIDSVFVNFYPSINGSSTSNQQICFGDTISLSANGGQSYFWTPITNLVGDTIINGANSANPQVFPNDTTTFNVTIIDENNCSEVYSTKINVNPLPNFDLVSDTSICLNDSLRIQESGGDNYFWSPNFNISDVNIPNPLIYNDVDTTYFVTVIDSNSCVNHDSIAININDLPAVFASSNDTSICFNESTLLIGTGAITYLWSPSASLSSSSIAFPEASPDTTTLYTLLGIDGNGCKNYDSININILNLPNADAGQDDTICPGIGIELNGSGGNEYQWINPINLTNFLIANPIATPDTLTAYILQVTDSNGCINTDTVVISLYEGANAEAGFDQNICPNDSVILTGSGGVTYHWEPENLIDQPDSAVVIVTPNENMYYFVEVTDTNGCRDTDSLQIRVYNAYTSPDTIICIGDSVQVNILGDASTTFNWTPTIAISDSYIDNPILFPTNTTTYFVEIGNSANCQIIDSLLVKVSEPIANFSKSVNAGCQGVIVNYVNTSENDLSIKWLFSDGETSFEQEIEKIFSFSEEFSASLTVEDEFGCKNTLVNNSNSLGFDDYFDITKPNVFTPDGNGENDIFFIDVPGKIYECTDLVIYNRWGQIQFISTGNNLRWDGRNNVGKIVPNGTYFYTLSVKNKLFKGSISLYR
tara:strand:+ start:20774 stop:27514 length:6741 start_codon:yes stop_codon:yes gene_type:complete